MVRVRLCSTNEEIWKGNKMMTRSYPILAFAAFPAILWGQFSSGSTGSDGALNLNTSGTVTLDPSTLPNKCANNICNFTSITIGASTTVVLTSQLWRNASVVWLSQSDVNVAGSLVLDGTAGAAMNTANPGINRFPSAPGPGGFPGGVGGYLNQPAQPGSGFGGGSAGTSTYANGGPGVYSYFNNQLTPLLGGAGGGGGYQGTSSAGGNGGAGGGAIRIVSSTSITVNGLISSVGGDGNYPVGAGNGGAGGNGSGGVIHLVAPAVSGSGTITTGGANSGISEISATNSATSGLHFGGPSVLAGLYNPPLPSGTPAVQVTSVNGVNAPQYPTASPTVPDVTITSAAPVSVAIAAQNVPITSTVTLYLTSENAPDAKMTCGALAGTVASSTATCTSVNFPSGVTITNILAVW
jgi:hypothetical protein